LNKEKMVGIVALAMLLVSLVGIQQGYARQTELPPRPVSALIESVSNPSGGCLNLGLNGGYGTVTISLDHVWIYLQHANPSSTYTISVGYMQTGVGCGAWQSVGSLNTDSLGGGTFAQEFYLPIGYSYIFEFKNSAGSIVYATDPLAL
jgi:hypothetical protein